MANLQEKKSEALAIIDSALAILNKFPDIETTNTSLSFNLSSNPFPFLMDAFKSTCGYNILIKIISEMIVNFLPAMELSVKAVLLANVKNLLSCSINPIIPDDLLRDGICFNLEQVDISDTLKYCPTDKIGQYFYFDNKNIDENGNETFKIPDELKNSKDFNCLLWFMKNRASHREVWAKKVTENDSFTSDSDYWNANADNGRGKCRKGAGIITLEYNESPYSLRDAEGNPYLMQTPYNNILHVFLGNAQETNEQYNTVDGKLIQNSREIKAQQGFLEKYQKELTDLQEKIKKNSELLQKGKITQDTYNAQYIGNDEFSIAVGIKNQILNGSIEITVLESELEKYGERLNQKLKDILKDIARVQKNIDELIKKKTDLLVEQEKLNRSYRSIEKNYYYKHTLLEFNTDYVLSLKLFDEKVIAAQLIDSLTNVLSIDLELSFKQKLIKNEIEKMCRMIIETDDTVVSDCFFTFTNDDYNAMLEKAELNRANLFSINGEENGAIQINSEELLSSLNELSSSANQVNNVTIIEHALTEISGMVSEKTGDPEVKTEFNFSVKMNFIEQLLNNLAYVIARSVLSPKLFLLILINLEIMGKDINFTLEEFIARFKQLIVQMLRAIRDLILEELTNRLLALLRDLAKEISVKIVAEQAMYYYRLLKSVIDCFKSSKRKGLDFNIDQVNYADILSEEGVDPKQEC